MQEWLQGIWKDPVWSKVIAGLILPVVLALIALLRGRFRSVVSLLFERPVIALIDVSAPPINPSPAAPLTYPLKCYVEMRNDSRSTIDVQVSQYRDNAVPIKKMVPSVLQIKFNRYFPEPDGAERIAVLPRQLFRAWIGIDETKFTDTQIMNLRGKIGTLVLSVNGGHVNIDL